MPDRLGVDLRPLPRRERKAALAWAGEGLDCASLTAEITV
jgi:hypothetical protein